jgi:transposase
MNAPPNLSAMTHEEKDAFIGLLLAHIAKQDERIKELERRLGLNSDNSNKPPSSDGYGKKPKQTNLREKTDKKSGGQEGHAGNNLEQVDKPNRIIDHCPSVCGECGGALGIEQSTGHRRRQVFDIPKPQPIEVTEHRAHRCQCPNCGTKTDASFPGDVTAPTQYGANIAAVVVYLQQWHLVPEDRLAELIRDVFGLNLTSATIAAMSQRKAEQWSDLADYIGELVKKAPVKHMDETGLRVCAALHWLHVASTWLLTFYRAPLRRNAMMEGVTGIIIHDFWKPYLGMVGVTHGLCNAHHLRELKALLEMDNEPWALQMYRFLRHACHAVNLSREKKQSLDPAFVKWLLARYDRIIAQGLTFHQAMTPIDPPGIKKRGRPRQRKGHNLVERLRDHKDDALRFLTNSDVPFTNNQAERDIRMMKLKQKISGCFRTETGAKNFAILRTVLSTARKQGWNILEAITTPPDILAEHLRTA